MASPIRLYYWNKTPNFGDVISPMIVAHVAGRPVEHAVPEQAELFALGSILRNVSRLFRMGVLGEGKPRPAVWGSGAMKPVGRGFLPHVDLCAVRGPKTMAALQVDPVPFGDPGLLIKETLGEDIAQTEAIGVIPHVSQLEKSWDELTGQIPGAVLIDVREDAAEVVRQIARCRHVFSSSLHGLIVADAYGVPNTWMDPAGIHAEPEFKFSDYAASIGRDIGQPCAPGDVPGLAAALGDPAPLPYAAGIEALKPGLVAAFPAALRG